MVEEVCMLRAAIICPDQNLTEQLKKILAEVGGVEMVRELDHYPNNTELVRVIRATAPQLIFVSASAPERIAEMAAGVEAFASGTQVVGIHHSYDPEILLEVMRAGVREFLAAPFDRQKVYDALCRAAELLEKTPPAFEASDRLFVFLPSKPGTGASTVAVNTALALARRPDMNVLLTDFDLNSGMVGFMLKINSGYSVLDAMDNSGKLDESIWPQLVSTFDRLDVLQAGTLNPGTRIEAQQIRRLVEFARRNYKAICVDVSGNMEKYSIELMQEANRILLVCTPEIPSLHLAREKLNFLRSVDLEDRVTLLLNRAQRRSAISVDEIEKLLGRKVLLSLPNDYNGVHRALTAGTSVQPSSDLGKSYDQLVNALIEKKVEAPGGKRRFVEYFSIVPARYSIIPGSKKS
jgi:pilus assembly protein CpaE